MGTDDGLVDEQHVEKQPVVVELDDEKIVAEVSVAEELGEEDDELLVEEDP